MVGNDATGLAGRSVPNGDSQIRQASLISTGGTDQAAGDAAQDPANLRKGARSQSTILPTSEHCAGITTATGGTTECSAPPGRTDFPASPRSDLDTAACRTNAHGANATENGRRRGADRSGRGTRHCRTCGDHVTNGK
jgi:hypothetical protein